MQAVFVFTRRLQVLSSSLATASAPGARHRIFTRSFRCSYRLAALSMTKVDSDLVKEGWFTELSTLWPGQGLSLKVKEVLFHEKSEYQDVCVFDSESAFGRVLTLDGVIQITDKDEFSYQEMITHLPLCGMQRAPEKVLIVGGGDGGVAREVAKHACVKHIDMAEIDKMIPEVSKRFFPKLASGFNDARLQVHLGDGVKFLEECPEATYDAIIVDSSDPVGPAEALFQAPFFKLMHLALKPGGVLSTQAESLWLHMDIIESLAKMCKEVFVGGTANYAFTTIPTYPSGQIGFMVCQKAEGGAAVGATEPHRQLPGGECKYYHPAIHKASFVLPAFAYERLGQHLSNQTAS